MCSLKGMERLLCITLWLLLTKVAVCSTDIFKDLSFPEGNNESANMSEGTYITSEDKSHCLLDVLGKHLLSSNEQNNILAQVLIKDKNSSETPQERLKNLQNQLEILLKPFADKNFEDEINSFIDKILNIIRPIITKPNLCWSDIKDHFPTLRILCRQLIDRVTTIF